MIVRLQIIRQLVAFSFSYQMRYKYFRICSEIKLDLIQ